MVDAVNFFQADALDLGVGLLANIELVFPWSELSAGGIDGDTGRRLANLGVWEDDGWWDVFRVFQMLLEDAGPGFDFRRRGEIGEFVVFVCGRISLEGAGLEPLER